jgi:hypothetical protein
VPNQPAMLLGVMYHTTGVPAAIVIGFLAVMLIALPIWFLWRALDRAGLPGEISLLHLLPLGFVVVLGILAFMEWPRLAPPSGQLRSRLPYQ